jgi:crotonobetainyl-CoA:carnitine CoA-transferase CaiB-like acyl-CoA transferase
VPGVLDGIKILDFGRYIAGPFCAALLGDLGAEVIRIERIGGGEDRGMIPVGAGPDAGGAMFLAMNRNKLGMTLDPATPKGREIVKSWSRLPMLSSRTCRPRFCARWPSISTACARSSPKSS